MVDDQHDHADRSADHDVQEIDQQRGKRPLHEDGFDEVVGQLRTSPFEPIAGQRFDHRHRYSRKQSALDDVHSIKVEGLEQTHKQQDREHDCRQGPYHDRLNRIGKGADQFLDGQRNDK